MYWMDYKLNKSVKEVSKKYEDLYISYLLSFSEVKITKHREDLIRKAVKCFFYNMSFYVGLDGWEVVVTLDRNNYTLPLIYNGRKINRKVSYQFSRGFFSWMHSQGLAHFDIGFVGDWGRVQGEWVPKTTKQSKVTIGDEIYNDLSAVVKTKKDTPTIPSVIEIRNKEGVAVTKNLDKPRQALLKMLNSYNEKSRNFKLQSQGREFDIQLKKVYNHSSFDKGGRSYVIGKGSELMKKIARQELTIDGESVVEIDFKSLHPRLVAEIIGVTLPDDFDPYGIKLEGYDDDCLRAICKLLVLCIFNASSEASAIAAVRKELSTLCEDDEKKVKTLDYWKEQGWVPEIIELKQISKLLKEHNNYAVQYMFTGYGMDLQNLDSRIMDCVVEHFTMVDEFVLPIHDSIVIRESLGDEAIRIMRVAYKQVMGSDNNCKLEVK
jgi:hypothetical protein